MNDTGQHLGRHVRGEEGEPRPSPGPIFRLTDIERIVPAHLTDDGGLATACRDWRQTGALAVDTEFVRTRTYFPKLGLVQVCDGREISLVDPLAVDDLDPLVTVLTDPSVTKVFHSCAEDLEVLAGLCGEAPGPIFDTQIAAAYCGFGLQVSYQALVRELLGVEIAKGETRSNWRQRPLTEAQVQYAALDVAFLLQIRDLLSARLERDGRLGWVLEESERMQRLARMEADPETAWLAMGGVFDLPRRDMAVLKGLAAWRERLAQSKDIPKTFLMPDKELRVLVKLKPTNVKKLATVPGLHPSKVRKFGKVLTSIVAEALELPEEALPERTMPKVSPRKVGRMVQLIRETVSQISRELDLPPELVARKRLAAELARNVLAGLEEPLPEDLSGWRREPVGERLLEVIRRVARRK